MSSFASGAMSVASVGLNIASRMGLGMRTDPVLSHSFMVEFDGLIVGGFLEVSGLGMDLKTVDIRAGGQNAYLEKVPDCWVQKPLVLKRGVGTVLETLGPWIDDVAQGKIERRDGSVILMTSELTELWRWDFKGAFPISWSGPNFRADKSDIAVEEIQLTHRGIWKSFALTGGLSGAASLGASISGGISL